MNDSRIISEGASGLEPGTMRAYVNERGVSVPSGASALDAVRAFDPQAADAVRDGTQRLTDSRGLPIGSDSPVHGGAIYRLLPVRTIAADIVDAAHGATGAGDAA